MAGRGKGKKGKDKNRKEKKKIDKFEPRNLPEDAVTEILLRSPVKSLLRFRCVSKRWRAQIDSLQFRKWHLAYLRQQARYDEDDEFLLVNREYTYYTDTFGFAMNVLSCYEDYESLSCLKSSCDLDIDSVYFSGFSYNINGIICFVRNGGGFLNVYLCNPALREFRSLHDFPRFPVEFGITYPTKASAVGIGFDDATDDYVVVKFVHPNGESRESRDDADLECVLYNVKTGCWTMIEIPPSFVSTHASTLHMRFSSLDKLYYASFFSHGCIHWCMDWCHLILTLNMNTKLFQEIQFPNGWKDYGYDEYAYLLMVDSSSIALVGTRGHDLHMTDIWVMKEYGVVDSWTKQYYINDCTIPGLPPPVPRLPRISRPLSFWREDKIFLLTMWGKLICYDLGKGQLYEPPRRGQRDPTRLPHPDMKILEVVTCCGSLVSVYQS